MVGVAIAAIVGLLAAGAFADDTAIAKNIVEKLRVQKQNGALKGFNVGVRVQNGDVWLEGQVSNPAQETLVLEIARRVPGVKQVVDDIHVAEQPQTDAAAAVPEAPKTSLLAGMTAAMKAAIAKGIEHQQKASVAEAAARASQVAATPPAAPMPAPAPTAPPMAAPTVPPMAAPTVAPTMRLQEPTLGTARVPTLAANKPPQRPLGTQNLTGVVSAPNARLAALTNEAPQMRSQQTPRNPASQMPVAFAPASTVMPAQATANAPPAPAYVPGTGGGVAPARYDHPYMPGYAWPSYASYPNYAGLTYPKQYSPTAWPYIGPFYPYPQVPLGWRKVILEWDDGWWMLDFKSVSHK
jgi:hypothetical protein